MARRGILQRLHGTTAEGVPRWAVWAAFGTTLAVLPSGIWRILALLFDVPLMEHNATPPEHHGTVVFDGLWYVVALSVVSELLAYLTFGLVATWGEVWPRWVPWLRGRRIPILAAVVPAGLGAVFLTFLWPYSFVMMSLGRMVNGAEGSGLTLNSWQLFAFIVSYGPLVAWGPLLGAVTIHYWRRRRTADRRHERAGAQAVAVR